MRAPSSVYGYTSEEYVSAGFTGKDMSGWFLSGIAILHFAAAMVCFYENKPTLGVMLIAYFVADVALLLINMGLR